MTREEMAAMFAEFGEQIGREAALKGPRRRIPGTAEFGAAIGSVIGAACPELQKPAGRALLEVLAGRLAEMCGEVWQRGYELGKSVGAAGAAGIAEPESAPEEAHADRQAEGLP